MLTLTVRPASPHWRHYPALLLALVLVLLLPHLGALAGRLSPSFLVAPPAPAQGQPMAPGETPAGLTPAAWGDIQA